LNALTWSAISTGCQISTSRLRFSLIAFALFARHAPANGTLSEFIFEHGVVAGTGAPEFFTGNNMAQVDEYKADTEKAEYDGKHEEEFHCMENLNAKVNNLTNNGGGGRVAASTGDFSRRKCTMRSGRTCGIIHSSLCGVKMEIESRASRVIKQLEIGSFLSEKVFYKNLSLKTSYL
jgi:hypothetical protein